MHPREFKRIAGTVARICYDVQHGSVKQLTGLQKLENMTKSYALDSLVQTHIQKTRLMLSHKTAGNPDVARHHIESGLALQTLANTSMNKAVIVMATGALTASSNPDILPIKAAIENDNKGASKIGRKRRVRIVFDLQSNKAMADQNLVTLENEAANNANRKLVFS